MRALVTGASGLIGSALCDHLLAEGHSLVCQSRSARPERPGVSWLRLELAKAKAEDLSLPQVDIVFHLAAQTSTYSAQRDPIHDLSSNVFGFLNLLQALRCQAPPPFIVLVGTVTQVGLAPHLPIREDMADRPVTFYDISKLTAELYLKQYVREGWLTGCCLRLANVYGRRESGQQVDRGIIDKIFNLALAGRDLTLYGDGDYLRDYIFIDDVISALMAASRFRERTNGRAFCIGSGTGIKLREAFASVAKLATSISGRQVQIVNVRPPDGLSPIEFRNAVIDVSAFKEATGWLPQYDFARGLRTAYQAVSSSG